jgi:hypothetical protein
MEATLTEVVNLGNRVQKSYYVTPAKVNNILLDYNIDDRSVDIYNADTNAYLETMDVSIYDEPFPNIDLDKRVFIDFFDVKNFVKIYKETDDYSDII